CPVPHTRRNNADCPRHRKRVRGLNSWARTPLRYIVLFLPLRPSRSWCKKGFVDIVHGAQIAPTTDHLWTLALTQGRGSCKKHFGFARYENKRRVCCSKIITVA